MQPSRHGGESSELQRPIFLQVQAYEHLKKAIITQSLKPGQVYSESKLSVQLGVSKTPVREALIQLRREGWVEVLPNRGVLIKELSEKDIREVFGIRRALEGWCLEELANTITETSLKQAEVVLARQNEIITRDDKIAWVSENVAFHHHFVALLENSRVQSVLNSISDEIQRMGLTLITHRDRMREAYEEHRKILEALRHRKGYEARDYLYLHLSRTEQGLLELYHSKTRQLRKDQLEIRKEGVS